MRMAKRSSSRRPQKESFLPEGTLGFFWKIYIHINGLIIIFMSFAIATAMATYHPTDRSLNTIVGTKELPLNYLGLFGSYMSDIFYQLFGLWSWFIPIILFFTGLNLFFKGKTSDRLLHQLLQFIFMMLFGSTGFSYFTGSFVKSLPAWTGGKTAGLGGSIGALLWKISDYPIKMAGLNWLSSILAAIFFCLSIYILAKLLNITSDFRKKLISMFNYFEQKIGFFIRRNPNPFSLNSKDFDQDHIKQDPSFSKSNLKDNTDNVLFKNMTSSIQPETDSLISRPVLAKQSKKIQEDRQAKMDFIDDKKDWFDLPSLTFLTESPPTKGDVINEEALSQNAKLLVSVLDDFGVNGTIVKVRPGPVVTLYELEPAPGTKTSRVIGLSDDIARSMSALSVRIATVPGRSVIGIEMPNQKRETVYLRELLSMEAFERSNSLLPVMLGKDIGGQPHMIDLTRMPHLLIAGTTGSGKSVAINTMILSLLYRLKPSECRMIMIDPKMLELSVYDGIPHLLTPVVTEPGKAVVALKWVVREMEDRYRSMSQLGVRNISGYNQRLTEAKTKGEVLNRTIQTGFDSETGKPIYEEQPLALDPLPFIVVIIDEMADLMLVAGKEIEGAVQRLAQMARAAGIHLMMATQRPSVDVITGTIKANFPSRISFQVSSKIDSRTILGEQGAEQLLGQGDMLFMAAGGKITRVHGPFVSDQEVETVANHLRQQGEPHYIEAVTEELDAPELTQSGQSGDENNDLYDQAVALVAREGKASTSFVQRHLQIGYNRAANLIEQMEKKGVISPANHVGKRTVLISHHGD